METQLLTPNQVAERLQLSLHTVYAWLRDGRLPGIRLGRRWRVSEESLAGALALAPPAPLPAGRRSRNGTSSRGKSTGEIILAILEEATKDIPAEAWAEMPPDASLNVDHYLYGAPKAKPLP